MLDLAMNIRFILALLLLLLPPLGCSSPSEKSITLATTTSARDSGLLDALLPRFRARSGIEVKVVAVGTGQALELGRRGDADVLLVHAPDAEKQFIAEGYGVGRRPLMHNDFVFVGPRKDPAGVAGETSAVAALRKIAQAQASFVSRGDDSGTHKKEKRLWREAGVRPDGDWYLEAGTGMAATLRVANGKRAYTLTDRGTFLAHRDRLDLAILCEGDPRLRNFYSVMLVNPARHPHVQAEAARRFIDFMTSPAVQTFIGQFGREQYGEPLFHAR
jgi:tungstate transport system substrate-binding protein